MNPITPNDRSLGAVAGGPEVSGAALWLAWARRASGGAGGAGLSGAGGLPGGFVVSGGRAECGASCGVGAGGAAGGGLSRGFALSAAALSSGFALSSGHALSSGFALSSGMSAASMGLLARACSRGGVVLHDGRRAAAAAMLAFALQMAAAPARAGEQITIPPDNDYPITIGIGGDYDTMTVNNGGTATDTTINVSGTQNVMGGGSANNTTISGGKQNIVSGGKATNTSIYSGGVQEVGAGGGEATSTTVYAGGHQSVDGGPATSTTINSGGSQTVWHDGTATSTTVNVGGQQVITSGGSAATTTINDGGQQVVIWGQATGTTVSGGGSQHVSSFTSGDYSGSGTVIGTILDGGTQVIDSGGAASATTVNSGGQQYVNSGGKVLAGSGANSSATIVNSGGSQHIASGGEAAGVTIADGGKQLVSKGGTATDVTVNSGGEQVFAAGGLISGGSNTIQGTAKGGTVISGAVQTVKGGSASGTVVSGTQVVDSGGTAQNVTVLAGGAECGQKVVYGTATSTTIGSGGYQHVSSAAAGSAGVASNANVLSGGTQVVHGGGSATATTVNKGGAMSVEGGGTANQVTLAGGALTMAAGASGTGTLQGHGAVSAAALNVGGANNFASVIVSSGALRATSSLQVNSGGAVTVNSGGTLSAGGALDVADNGAVTVSGGGVLSAASVSAAATATVSLSGGTLAATGAIDLRQGLTGARGNVRAGTELRIAGATQASGALNLYAGTNLMPTGAIDVNLVSAGGDVGDAGNRQNLTAVTVVAGGKVTAEDLAAANLTAGSLDAAGDVTLTNGKTRVSGDAVVAGTFTANGGDVGVGGTLDANLQIAGGGLVAAQDLALDGHTATVTSGGLTLGSSDNTEMQKALKKAGASAGLSIAKTTDLSGSTGKIMVGAGAADPGAGGVSLASNTALDVNAAAAQGGAPILKAKALNIAPNATLSVSDIDGAKTFTAFQAETVTGAFAAVVTDSVFFMGILNPDGTVRLEQVPTGELMPKMDSGLAALLTGAAMNGEIGTDDAHVFSQHGGARLLSRAISREYLGGDLERASVTIEGVARGAAVGGVPQMAFAIARAGAGAVGERLGALGAARAFPLAAPGGAVSQAAGGAPTDGFAEDYASYGGAGLTIWGMPLYQNWNAQGLPAGDYDLDGWGWLAGGAVGADWTFDSRLRLGAAFDFGAGNAEGGGDFNRTLNDMSFWGVNLYGGWKPGAFGVFADVGFASGWNRFRQNLPPELQMADLEAGIASWALSTGLRAEYEFHTGVIDAIPHVGVRYSHLKTEEYSLKSGGLTVLTGDAICQNVWSLPIGVTFARNFALGRGWALRPSIDARITPNMGDVDARGGVSFTGVSGQAELRTQVMDYVLFGGTAGAELRKGERLRLGAHYDFEVGDHSAQHGVFATLTWRF